jgi:redox-sensitive bicupin YhaK (pirin superfamily)
MIHVFPKQSRFSQDHGWLQSNFVFSFGDYYDARNTAFGPLRVCNDDTVAPRRGFGAHPHCDMEIVSVVLSGKLRHEDNLGNVAVTGFGEVQRMSAGTGVIHTEANPSENVPVNLLQMWFEPEQRGLTPSYETSRFDVGMMTGRLLPIVSRAGGEGIARIHQDMTIYVSRVPGGTHVNFEQSVGRRIFLFVIEGVLDVRGHGTANGFRQALHERDTARITGTLQLALAAMHEETSFLLIDLP